MIYSPSARISVPRGAALRTMGAEAEGGSSSSGVVVDVAMGMVQLLAMCMGQLVGQQLGGCQLLQACRRGDKRDPSGG